MASRIALIVGNVISLFPCFAQWTPGREHITKRPRTRIPRANRTHEEEHHQMGMQQVLRHYMGGRGSFTTERSQPPSENSACFNESTTEHICCSASSKETRRCLDRRLVSPRCCFRNRWRCSSKVVCSDTMPYWQWNKLNDERERALRMAEIWPKRFSFFEQAKDFNAVMRVGGARGENHLNQERCWPAAESEHCCNTILYGRGGKSSCWLYGGSFEECCADVIFSFCENGCTAHGMPSARKGVSEEMCKKRFDLRICDFGWDHPQITMHVSWSLSYFTGVVWMLRSLHYADEPVRVVLRQVNDTRNASSGDQFSWGPEGYQMQKRVRADWFQTITRAHWNGLALISDVDVEFFPGWLTTVVSCMYSGVDMCLGQQAGSWEKRENPLNPGFMAIRGNERMLRLFEGMPEYGWSPDAQGRMRLLNSEVKTLNLYLHEHPPDKGGPHWAAFHPEVVMTSLAGLQVNRLRLRVLHAATGKCSYVKKLKIMGTSRDGAQKGRRYCARSGAGAFPHHPACSALGEGGRNPYMEFRVGSFFSAADYTEVLLDSNRHMADFRKDNDFQRLLIHFVQDTDCYIGAQVGPPYTWQIDEEERQDGLTYYSIGGTF